jgi:hypothetical protein
MRLAPDSDRRKQDAEEDGRRGGSSQVLVEDESASDSP